MPALESEEYDEQTRNQKGQGLKESALEEMLTRLPISLAHLKSGNNSKKLKHEIRQLLYFLYRSKKINQNNYNKFINTF